MPLGELNHHCNCSPVGNVHFFSPAERNVAIRRRYTASLSWPTSDSSASGESHKAILFVADTPFERADAERRANSAKSLIRTYVARSGLGPASRLSMMPIIASLA